jgi:hypothetical protein
MIHPPAGDASPAGSFESNVMVNATAKAQRGDDVAIPSWLWQTVGASAAGVGILALTVAGWIGSVAWGEIGRQGQSIEAVTTTQTRQEVEIKHLKEFADRTDGKLDRILELLRNSK